MGGMSTIVFPCKKHKDMLYLEALPRPTRQIQGAVMGPKNDMAPMVLRSSSWVRFLAGQNQMQEVKQRHPGVSLVPTLYPHICSMWLQLIVSQHVCKPLGAQEFSACWKSKLQSCRPTLGWPWHKDNDSCRHCFVCFKILTCLKLTITFKRYYFCPHLLNFAQGHTLVRRQSQNSNSPPSGPRARAPNHCNMQDTGLNGEFYIKHCLDLKVSKGSQ